MKSTLKNIKSAHQSQPMRLAYRNGVPCNENLTLGKTIDMFEVNDVRPMNFKKRVTEFVFDMFKRRKNEKSSLGGDHFNIIVHHLNEKDRFKGNFYEIPVDSDEDFIAVRRRGPLYIVP